MIDKYYRKVEKRSNHIMFPFLYNCAWGISTDESLYKQISEITTHNNIDI